MQCKTSATGLIPDEAKIRVVLLSTADLEAFLGVRAKHQSANAEKVNPAGSNSGHEVPPLQQGRRTSPTAASLLGGVAG